MTHATAAVVFVLSRYLLRDADCCIQYCITCGYSMVGVVKDDWAEAMRMLHDGRAEVLVVADEQHLDPDRSPRVEVVARQPPAGTLPAPRTERSRMVRRNAGG